MRTSLRTALIGAVVGAMGVAGSLFAYANWLVPGQATTFKVNTAEMPAGARPSVSKQSKTVVVTWAATEIAHGVKMQRYVVTAHSSGNPPLQNIVRTVTATGAATETALFTVAELKGGTWQWGVQPEFEKWVGAESGLSDPIVFGGTPPAVPNAQLAAAPVAVVTTGPPAPVATATQTSSPPETVVAPPEVVVTTTAAPPPPVPVRTRTTEAAPETTAPAAEPTTTAPPPDPPVSSAADPAAGT